MSNGCIAITATLMKINHRQAGKKWIAEVWTSNESETYPEQEYVKINDWCKETFGYHARTAYHIFEFKSRPDLDWFILRWS